MRRGRRSRVTLRTATLRVSGTIALAAAGHQVVGGLATVRGVDGRRIAEAAPSLDSEMRFYAVWYAAAGALMHRAACDPRVDRDLAAGLPAAWAVGALSRLLSMRSAGRPAPLFVALTALELAVAGLLAVTEPQDAAAQPPVARA